MKVIVALALVVMVFGSQLSSDISKTLDKLVDHPFSKSMVSLVNLNMQTGGPLQELRLLLQSIKDELLSLTQTQDQEAQQNQRRCQQDIATLSATLESGNADLSSQRSEQTSLLGEQTGLSGRVSDDSNALERNGRSQQETGDRLESENSDYEGKNGDYSDAVLACKEAQRLLLNLKTEGTSLVQISQETKLTLIQTKDKIKKIKEILEKHSKKTSLTLFQPIIEGLVEMSTEVNPETLNNVLNLIARLITALQEGQDQLEDTHSTQISNLSNLQTDLSNEKDTLQSSITTTNNRLKEIQSRLNELDGLLANSNAIVKVTGVNLDDVKSGCRAREEESSQQSVSRKTEIDIVDRLVEFVDDRLADE